MMDILLSFVLGALAMWGYAELKKQKARALRQQYNVVDPRNQIKFIESTDLLAAKPINAEAFRTVFTVVEQMLQETSPRYRLLAEVCMGSFLRTRSKYGADDRADRAYRSINSKRVDFLIIDPFGRPKLVIEYHGSGHYQGNADERNAVKKVALTRAGIPFLEFYREASPEEVASKVRKILSR